MTTELILAIAIAVFAFAIISSPAARSPFSAPMIFLALGVLFQEQIPVGGGAREALSFLGELTLVVVLFTDAARINLGALWNERGLPVRLLMIGLPATILAGGVAATLMLPELALAEAMLIGAMLAPTDAALGQAVISNEMVPLRVRQALNAESGLNDGIAFPVVLAIAAMASMESAGEAGLLQWAAFGGRQILLGALVGLAVCWVGGRLLKNAEVRARINPSFDRLALLALAGAAFAGAELVGGNGFIAAFVGGLTLAQSASGACTCIYEFGEAEGQLLSLIVFTLFGAVLVPEALPHWSPSVILYAVLSLTVVRMLPVAISLLGTGADWATIGFVGWFGPRGLASIIFMVVVLKETPLPHAETIAAVVTLVVAMSTLAHGATAYPLARLYGRSRATVVPDEMQVLPVRIRHSSGPPTHHD